MATTPLKDKVGEITTLPVTQLDLTEGTLERPLPRHAGQSSTDSPTSETEEKVKVVYIISRQTQFIVVGAERQTWQEGPQTWSEPVYPTESDNGSKFPSPECTPACPTTTHTRPHENKARHDQSEAPQKLEKKCTFTDCTSEGTRTKCSHALSLDELWETLSNQDSTLLQQVSTQIARIDPDAVLTDSEELADAMYLTICKYKGWEDVETDDQTKRAITTIRQCIDQFDELQRSDLLHVIEILSTCAINSASPAIAKPMTLRQARHAKIRRKTQRRKARRKADLERERVDVETITQVIKEVARSTEYYHEIRNAAQMSAPAAESRAESSTPPILQLINHSRLVMEQIEAAADSDSGGDESDEYSDGFTAIMVSKYYSAAHAHTVKSLTKGGLHPDDADEEATNTLLEIISCTIPGKDISDDEIEVEVEEGAQLRRGQIAEARNRRPTNRNVGSTTLVDDESSYVSLHGPANPTATATTVTSSTILDRQTLLQNKLWDGATIIINRSENSTRGKQHLIKEIRESREFREYGHWLTNYMLTWQVHLDSTPSEVANAAYQHLSDMVCHFVENERDQTAPPRSVFQERGAVGQKGPASGANCALSRISEGSRTAETSPRPVPSSPQQPDPCVSDPLPNVESTQWWCKQTGCHSHLGSKIHYNGQQAATGIDSDQQWEAIN